MTIPLMFLAVVTIVAGFIPFGKFISSNGTAYEIHLDWTVAGTSIAIAVISIAIATAMYARAKQPVANALAHRFRGLWTAAYHRFYIDEVYQFITHKIIFGCISRPIAWFDRHVVDGYSDAGACYCPIEMYLVSCTVGDDELTEGDETCHNGNNSKEHQWDSHSQRAFVGLMFRVKLFVFFTPENTVIEAEHIECRHSSNDGSSRSLSCSTNVPVVHRLCTGCAAPGSLRRSFHCILRRFGSLCAE